MKKSVFAWISLVALCVGLAATANAQVNTATITGTVQDASGAVITGATVEVRDAATGAAHSTTSTDQGAYTFEFLPVGTYTIVCNKAGFATVQRTQVVLVAAQELRLDFSLQAQSVQQNVVVTAAEPLIDSVSSQDNNYLAGEQVSQLPIARLNWTNLLTQMTGAIKQTSSGSSTQNLGVALNGLPTAAFNLTVDGTNAAADPEVPIFGFYQSPNIIDTIAHDAIQEVSVVKGVPPATEGGLMSGGVNIITRSGTNAFHGDVFERNEVSALDARNYFSPTKPRLTFNQFGGSLGGPIFKNKLFFFGAYEGARESQFEVISGSVPTTYARAVAPAAFTNELNTIPTLPQPAGDPSDCYVTVNPAIDPNCHTNATYHGTGAQQNFDSSTVARIDQTLNAHNSWYARYTRNRPYQNLPALNVTNPQVTTAHGDVYNVGFLHQFSNLISNSRFGYNRLRLDRAQLGLYNDNEGITFGFGTGNSEVFTKAGRVATGEEQLAMTLGKHTLQFGGIFQRNDAGRTDRNTSTFSYSSTAQFAANTPSSATLYVDVTPFNLYQYQFGGYIQDDYRLSQTLTLNLGFRYDYYTVIKESSGRVFNRGYDPVLGNGFGPFRPANSMYNADYHTGFQPRLGFAWSPRGVSTVVRGGFGILTTRRPIYGGPIGESPTSATLPANLALTQTQLKGAGLGFPVPRANVISVINSLQAAGVVGTSFANSSIDPNFNNPYAIEWTLAVEQALPGRMVLDLGYVGNHALNENFTYIANEPIRGTTKSPMPLWGTFTRYIAGDKSNYNALQAKLNKQVQYGLSFGAYYTWAKSLSFGDANLLLETSPQDLNNLRAEYGPSQYDIRDDFSGNILWDVPFNQWFHSSSRVFDELANGWRTTFVINANTGLPANVLNGSSAFAADRPDLLLPNPYLTGYHAAGPSSTAHRYLNPAAFTPSSGPNSIPLIGGIQSRDGNITRNYIRNIGQYTIDLSAAKTFTFTESTHLEFRVDAFNFMNHTNFTGLGTSTNSSSFGFFTSATPRSIQLGGRFTF